MKVINTKEPVILFLGDLTVLFGSLWITLCLRYLSVPSIDLWNLNFIPFLSVFILWIVVFYIAGLYEKHTTILRNNIPSILFNAHIVSGLIATSFFYLIPFFSITPKTILFIFIAVSFFILYLFRVFVYPKLFNFKKQKAILIGEGVEVEKLFQEINQNKYYQLYFSEIISPQDFSRLELVTHFKEMLQENNISIVVIDMKNKNIESFLPTLYDLLLEKVVFIDLYKVYENVFDKVPLSLVQYNWFIENISVYKHVVYDALKRSLDIFVSCVGGMISLLLYPFVILAIKIEDGGSIFITQERVGQNRKPIKIYKFRSMQRNENGVWVGESQNKITKVGKFLRKSSIDEFPQFWNVLKGDLSLIGPRPDMTKLEERLVQEIPYYNMRYSVKPGLSGWAQTKQDIIPNNIEENKDRLAYDLYYIKNRSIYLDIQIILKTIKALLIRGGR